MAKKETTTTTSTNTNTSYGGWLQRVRQTGEFSDVIVIVEAQEFHLHSLPLINGSSFFRATLLSSSKSSSSSSSEEEKKNEKKTEKKKKVKLEKMEKRRVELPDLVGGTKAFSIAISFCYLIKPSYGLHNIASIRAVAEQLGMEDLLESTRRYLYAKVFGHWRSSLAFLHQLGTQLPGCHPNHPPLVLHGYIEPRCLKSITSSCAKAFSLTNHISLPLPIPSYTPIPHPSPSPSSSLSSSSSSSTTTTSSSTTTSFHSFGYYNSPSPFSPCSDNCPSRTLAELLARISTLPDRHVGFIINELVNAHINLSLKCRRQGRAVKAWLDALLTSGCSCDRSRSWVVVCLTRMMEKTTSVVPSCPGGAERPWLQLCSQYWCTLLEHASRLMMNTKNNHNSTLRGDGGGNVTKEELGGGECVMEELKLGDGGCAMEEQLGLAVHFLEERIGGSLHELDEYLHSYQFEAQTIVSLVRHFQRTAMVGLSGGDLEEVASEVDSCMFRIAASQHLPLEDFIFLVRAFPPSSRTCHDLLYSAIEKQLTMANGPPVEGLEQQKDNIADKEDELWQLVDPSKLSPTFYDKAMSNSNFLRQPHVFEDILRQQINASKAAKDEDEHDLRWVMHKVIHANLKLLEENTRRSKEIVELQKQYTTLVNNGKRCQNSPNDVLKTPPCATCKVDNVDSGCLNVLVTHEEVDQEPNFDIPTNA